MSGHMQGAPGAHFCAVLGVTHGTWVTVLLERLARLPGARRSLARRLEHRPLDSCDPFLKQAGQAQGKQAEAASSLESFASPRHLSELQ